MSVDLKTALTEIVSRGALNDDDVQKLRQIVFADYKIDETEADIFVSIDTKVQNTKKSWDDFISEVLFDFVVFDIDGNRQANNERLKFLISKFTQADGRFYKLSHLKILAKIANSIESGAKDLNLLILNEIQKSIETGIGATKSNSESANTINEVEIEIIRQVLHNIGGENGMTISKSEAEYIQKIKDLVVNGDAAIGFEELYIKAIANHFRAHNFDSPSYPSTYTNSQFFSSLRAGFTGKIRNFWNDAHSDAIIDKEENFDALEQKTFEKLVNSDGMIDAYEAKAIEYLKSA